MFSEGIERTSGMEWVNSESNIHLKMILNEKLELNVQVTLVILQMLRWYTRQSIEEKKKKKIQVKFKEGNLWKNLLRFCLKYEFEIFRSSHRR